MATDSEVKLTKYKSAVTIITADFANSIFGGLYGSAEANSMDENDPRVRGHVHTGEHGDGHAPKVHLVDHVEDRLEHDNLADDAVWKRNVKDTIYQDEAIPEYRIDDAGDTLYYLDLRSIRADLTFQEIDDPAGDGSQHKLIRQRSTEFDGDAYTDIPNVWRTNDGFDFVFGSSSLEDLDTPDGDGDSRFQFDKSKSAFRAGLVTGDEWNETNRGEASVAIGEGSKASGDYSSVSGGQGGEASGTFSSVSGGFNNTASETASTVSGGALNEATGINSFVGGGASNKSTEQSAVVAGGSGNEVFGSYSTIAGGKTNKVTGDAASICGGEDNEASGNQSTISGGYGADASGNYSAVLGGFEAEATGNYSAAIAGMSNKANGDYSVSVGGHNNQVTADYGGICGGNSNVVESANSFVSGGETNILDSYSPHSFIGGGLSNQMSGSHSSILGGEANIVAGGVHTVVTGGLNNEARAEKSVVSGGSNNHTGAIHASVFGGEGNQALASHSLVAGGEIGIVQSGCSHSVIIGGTTNSISVGSVNTILGSSNSVLMGAGSTMIGSMGGVIMDSVGATITSSGKGTPTSRSSVGFEYSSVTGDLTSGASHFSGVVGGYNNHITGGARGKTLDPENNYIIGAKDSKIGGIEGAVFNSIILGGTSCEMTVIDGTARDVSEEVRLDSNLMVGATGGLILMDTGASSASASVIHSGLIGGVDNGINAVLYDATDASPWWSPKQHYGNASPAGAISEWGVQTSFILGGIQNSITNSNESGGTYSFYENSLYSTVIGGQKNIISSSYGSTILGGGAFVAPHGHSGSPSLKPPYDLQDKYYPNLIVRGHHSSILNGSSNLIKPIVYQFGSQGPVWAPYSKMEFVPLPEPVFSTAEGRESFSYLYGQKASASGGWQQDVFESRGFPVVSTESSPGAYYNVLLGSVLYPDNSTKDQPGTAQASSFTFFGSWDYTAAEIDPSWNPAGSDPYFDFRAYLDGGLDTAMSEPNRAFIPRYPGSYSFTIQGALSFSKPTGSDYTHATTPEFGAEHHVISFTYTGYIVMQPEASGLYGGSLTNVTTSMPGVTLDLFDDTGSMPKKDFLIGFCPEYTYYSLNPVNPLTVHTESYTSHSPGGPLVASAAGSWKAPHLASDAGTMPPGEWPPRFSIYVVNNTGNSSILGGNGTGNELVGESLVAKATIVENLLFLGKFNNGSGGP